MVSELAFLKALALRLVRKVSHSIKALEGPRWATRSSMLCAGATRVTRRFAPGGRRQLLAQIRLAKPTHLPTTCMSKYLVVPGGPFQTASIPCTDWCCTDLHDDGYYRLPYPFCGACSAREVLLCVHRFLHGQVCQCFHLRVLV